MTDRLGIDIGGVSFEAKFESAKAPLTCAAFKSELAITRRIVHVRWSGEVVWIPIADMDFQVWFEAATSYPTSGQVLLYPDGKAKLRF